MFFGAVTDKNFRSDFMGDKLMAELAAAALLAGGAFLAAGESQNLIRNGGFEEIENIGLESVSVPGWTINGRKKSMVQDDSAEDLFGDRSLKIEYIEVPESGDWEIWQDIPAVAFEKNTDYSFNGWMSSYKGSSKLSVKLLKDGKVTGEKSLDAWDGSGEYRNSGLWTEYRTNINSGDSDSLRIVCALKNDKQFIGDTVWFDGLELVRKDSPKSAAAPEKQNFRDKIFVSAKAPDGGDGSAEKPFKSIQTALNEAGPGTTVKVAAGVYVENLRFVRGGAAGAPLTLEGEPGAELQGAAPAKLNWEKVPDWGETVYRVKSPIGFVRGVYYGEKAGAEFKKLPLIRYERTCKDVVAADFCFYYRNVFKDGVMTPEKKPGQGFDVLRAVAMYNPEDRCVYIRFGDNQDPNNLFFKLVKGTSLINIDGLGNIEVKNLTLRCSVKGVSVSRSENVTVQNCKFETVEYGIKARFCESVRALFNVLSLNGCHTMNPHQQVVSSSRGPLYQADVWRAFKWAGYYDRCGILMIETGNCEAAYNYIHDHWDGISAYGGRNLNLKVHHNYVTNICDDGITIYGDAGQEWHHNTVVNSFANLRYWNNVKSQGPVYIYGNDFIHGHQDNIRLMNDTDMKIYIYHNSSAGGDGIRYQAQEKTGTPNVFVINNRFLGDIFGMTSRVRKAGVKPNFHASNNTYLTDRCEVVKNYGINENGVCGMDYIGKGADLSKFFGEPLPGCPPGYFKGNAPDCGADQLK
jgi:hypothetical protein